MYLPFFLCVTHIAEVKVSLGLMVAPQIRFRQATRVKFDCRLSSSYQHALGTETKGCLIDVAVGGPPPDAMTSDAKYSLYPWLHRSES